MSRVLIADDERVVADTLALIIRSQGHEATTAYCGKKAVEQAVALRPQLAILDVLMPDISGIEAAVLILRDVPTCKILLCSGQATTMDLLEETRANGVSFELLAKPINPEMLIEIVRERLNGKDNADGRG